MSASPALRTVFMALLLPALGLPACELVLGRLPDGADARDASAAGGGAGHAGNDGGSSAGQGGAAATGGAAGQAGAAGASGTSGAGGSGGSGCSDPCDCDNDGARAANVQCNGNDCDDHDPDAKPGQSSYFGKASSNPSVGFDFNCNGAQDRDPTLDKLVTCSGLSLGACDTATQGFIDSEPACGKSGSWGTCKKGTLNCIANPIGSDRTMLCH